MQFTVYSGTYGVAPRWTDMRLRRSIVIVLSAYGLAVCLAVLYDRIVVQQVDENDSATARTTDGRLTKILVPDALYYRMLRSYIQSTDADFLSFAIKSPNVLLPALVAEGFRYVSDSTLFLNIGLLALCGILLARLLTMLQIRSTVPLVLFFLNPETIYYMQGILKELPSTVLVLSFAVALLHQRHRLCLLLVVLAVPLRWQIAGILCGVLLLQWIPPRLRFRTLHGGLICLCVLLPLLYQSVLRRAVTAGEIFETEVPGTGVGASLNAVLRTVPGSGYVILPIRALQNMIEPFPGISPIEEGMVNVYSLVLLGSFLLMTGCYLVALREGWLLLRGKEDRRFVTPRAQVMLLVILYMLGTAANPWVHHRYIYPVVPLLGMMPWLRPRSQRMMLLYGMAACMIFTICIVGSALRIEMLK